MSKINFDKAVEDFCKEQNICPSEIEKVLLKSAMLTGRILTLEDEVKELKERLD